MDKVRELAELHLKLEANEARKAFAHAFAAAQADLHPVALDSFNSHTKSQYASLPQVNRALRPVLARHGFSQSFSQVPRDGEDLLRFRLTIRHEAGHEESHFMEALPDVRGPKGNVMKTDLHGRASAGLIL